MPSGLLLLLGGCAAGGPVARTHALPEESRYVAMGSSFAAGPGVTSPAENPTNRCSRSADNYARQRARKRNLFLVDVSCAGATTAHILGPWGELPPQLNAVDADTRLVTITIGGNDVSYMGWLVSASCQQVGPLPGAPSTGCPVRSAVSEETWSGLELRMRRIAGEVRRRAPDARIVFVAYLSVLPATGTCPNAPMTLDGGNLSSGVYRRLAAFTAHAA